MLRLWQQCGNPGYMTNVALTAMTQSKFQEQSALESDSRLSVATSGPLNGERQPQFLRLNHSLQRILFPRAVGRFPPLNGNVIEAATNTRYRGPKWTRFASGYRLKGCQSGTTRYDIFSHLRIDKGVTHCAWNMGKRPSLFYWPSQSSWP